VEQHHAIVRAELARWRGLENDTAGDGFYATFDGPAKAIRCALEVVDRVRELGLEVRGRTVRGPCLADGEGSHRRVRIHLR
jgi:class 3 adenylate cyclase